MIHILYKRMYMLLLVLGGLREGGQHMYRMCWLLLVQCGLRKGTHTIYRIQLKCRGSGGYTGVQ